MDDVADSVCWSDLRLRNIAGGAQRFGRLRCGYCKLQTPPPDEGTLGLLREFYKRHYFSGIIGIGKKYHIVAGDVIVICNRSYCADYTLSSTRDWEGSNVRKVERHVLNQFYHDDLDRRRKSIPPELARERERELSRPRGTVDGPGSGRWGAPPRGGRVSVGAPSKP